MLVSFDSLPDTSRIWIYQSNRAFTDKELVEIKKSIEDFVTQWTAHGAQLKAGYDLPYNRFIVLAMDQSHNAASGCSIDASVHFIQLLEKTYGLDLLDKMNVTYKQGEHIAYKPLKDFRVMAKNRAVSGKTIVFNNLVINKLEYKNNWEVPASESWHSRFF